MGRKKGKQSWGGVSKAAIAAQWKEVEEEVYSYRQKYHKQQQHKSSSNSNKNGNKNETRPTLKSTSLLRSLLNERREEDRWLNRQQRRRIRNEQFHNRPLFASTNYESQTSKELHLPHHPSGWLLAYDHSEALAGIVDDDQCSRRGVPLLLELAIQTLASVLDEYIDHLSLDTMAKIVSTLPPNTLSYMSHDYHPSNPNNGDAILQILLHPGNNINCSKTFNHNRNHTSGIIISKYGQKFIPFDNNCTNEEQFYLKPTIELTEETLQHLSLEEKEENSVRLNWETWIQEEEEEDAYLSSLVLPKSCAIFNFHNLYQLKRMELQHWSVPISDLLTFLKKTPQLTHLSLANYHPSWTGNSTSLLSKILDCLPNLEVLDLSFCSWMTPQILLSSLLRANYNDDHHQFWQDDESENDHFVPENLQLISVYGCPQFYGNNSQIHLIQEQLRFSIPHLSLQRERQKKQTYTL